MGRYEVGDGPRDHVPGTVYLLHFDPPFKHAKHYLGWTEGSVNNRLATHLSGQGSPLVKAAIAAGSTILLVRTWKGEDRFFERRLKRASHVPRHCPVCWFEAMELSGDEPAKASAC